jgi:formiminotetrahydrofolate cyclodeaminase
MGVTADGSVRAFLDAVASPAPTPGGGSAVALAGALSVALARMACNLAVGKEGYEDVQDDLRDAEGRGRDLQARLLALVDEDAAAYDAVVAAMRLPRGTAEERGKRVEAMQEAFRRAAAVPLETMERCLDALHLAEIAAKKGNRNAITDAGVAAALAAASLHGAALNVRINLAAIKDEAFRAEAEEKMASLLTHGEDVARRVLEDVEGKL